MSRVRLRERSTYVSELAARLRERVRRPADVFEATRWLFALLALVSVPLAALAPFASSRSRLVGTVSVIVLGVSWASGYLRRRAPLVMDVIDALALAVFAASCSVPVATFGLIFGALWFRSLYGSSWRALVRCALYTAAMLAALVVWPHLTGRLATADAALLLGVVPTMVVTVVVGQHLAETLAARNRGARLDAVNAALGSALLGVTDAPQIRRIGWIGIEGICAVVPGLAVLKVSRVGPVLLVGDSSAGCPPLPRTLATSVLAIPGGPAARGAGGDEPDAAAGRALLDAAVGLTLDWACVALPIVDDQPEGAWLLLGSPGRLLGDVVASLASQVNQVTLALRSSDIHRALTAQATRDGLTGLANRSRFTEALAASAEAGPTMPTSVLFVDLDDFKDVNDALGHRAGDDLLCAVATRLRAATRPDDLCARIGGDEFAVLLRGTDSATATLIAQRVAEAIAQPAVVDGGVARVGASVGVATAIGDVDVEQLVHRADVAMYAAKARGKARIQVFEPGLARPVSPEVGFERQLAAAARNDELVVHYQPVLSLPERRCTAVEALVRWQHPTLGLLYPDAFIELAERIGVIGELGTFVLRRACADVATWTAAHPDDPIAVHVNVSAIQLDDAGFIDTVMCCLEDFQVPANQLVLEITESIVISSPDAIARLHALVALGVIIAIDDFGTGYAALTTLRTLPVQIVKIDKSFVAGSTENVQDRAVTEAVVTMATKLGMRTIAEGVEEPEQQQYLEQIGADGVQGYLYLRPASAEAFGVWLSGHLAGLVPLAPVSAVILPFSPRERG